MKRLALDKTSDSGVEGLEKSAMTARNNSNTICYGGESTVETKFETCKCNNNIGDCDFGANNREIKVNCACLKENRQNDGNISVESAKQFQKKRRPKKRKSFTKRSKRHSENKEMCQVLGRIKEENKSCGISSEHNLSTVGGDGEEKRRERSRCRQHELNPSSNEINRPDVTMSRDLTSNSVIKSKSEYSDEENNQNRKVNKDCPRSRTSSCSVFQSTCSEGSYSRRKHHKHHKHKKRNSSPVHSEENAAISPKVNPIFLWVRQEDTKIVEVLCEDYDHRNRLRLTRTHLGWRAIPKTKTFAEAIIPKAVPKEDKKGLNNSVKPKHLRRIKKRKKTKRKKEQKILPDNPSQIKECSVALCRDDLANYKCKALISNSSDRESEISSESKSYLAEPEKSQSPNQSRPSSPESIFDSSKCLTNFRKLTKSNSCDFSSFRQTLKSFPRSISLDLKLTRNNIDFKVQKDIHEVIKSKDSKEIADGIKSECEVEKGTVEEQVLSTERDPLCETEFEKPLNQRNHSESVVVDMTKHDLDFNDTDCDELGQLLKDIPDLEFVEEEELEEIDEEDDWLKPTDLTVQKSASKNEIPGIKLPANITPVVTVTSSVKAPEPLTAPLPEVTITPISKPKPAHQQKPQNNFLESLLSSSRSVKPETCEMKKYKFPQFERKAGKHFQDDIDSQVRNKKLKVEDITLKSLLSRHQSGRTVKPTGDECSNSRLQELLTDTISSDPITQLKEVLSNPLLSVPDPLLVPRARLPALVASPASEIPRLLSMHLEKTIEETPCPPVTDSDILEVSLSNLQSLLSCTPEKLTNANTQDISKYQKSLETFLEWQRYQSELMESQIKNSKSMLSGFPGDISDVAAATAFSQMLWLPYLNQFDFNCNANRDFMSITNSLLVNDYQANCSNLSAPPQINTNQVSQPSPFLTPTSPMEFESHLKTLAMWQEALMMQQNSQFSRTCTKVSSTSNHHDVRRNTKYSNFGGMKKSNPEPSPKASTLSPISSRVENNHSDFEIYQGSHPYQNEYNNYKRQNRQSNFQHRQEHQSQCSQNQFRKMHQTYSNYQTELIKQCKVNDKAQLKKSGPTPGSISVKPLANLIDKSNLPAENKISWEHSEEDSKRNSDFTSQVASKLLQFNTQIQRTKRREDKPVQEDMGESKPKQNPTDTKPCLTETPKLKVKNLVDPNMSPPKLLKQIAPEHLPMVMDDKGPGQDDGQPNLWHPLFGSLNRMHVMEEGNGKIRADTAELPETQPDLPKKANTVGKELDTVISLEESDSILKSSSPVLNGVPNETKRASESRRNSSETKSEFEADDSETKDGVVSSKTTSGKSIEIKREPEAKVDSQMTEEEEKDREKSLEPQDLTVTCTPNFENSSKTSQNEKHYSNNKIISISVEQCQTNSSPVNSIPEDLKKPKPISNRKRSNKSTDSDESYKSSFKRSKFHEVNYDERERTVSEYVEKATGSSLDELQMNTEKLQQEIHSLSALARAKELEWNDIIRLKKVKEEIYLRLVRRKQVMLLSMSGSGRMSDTTNWDFASDNRLSEFVTNDEVSYNRVPSSVSPKPPPRIPSNLTITKSQNNPNQNLQRFLMQQPQGNSDAKSNASLMMVPIMSSTPISISSTSSYLSRPQLPTPLKIPIPDREKLKGPSNRNAPVPILPKPNQNVNHSVNNHSPPIGRQGPIVDVKSIIADYRQNHPEQVPRRGRRPKGQPSQNFADTMISSGRGVLSMSSLALGSGAQVRTVGSNSELGAPTGQNSQESSRPSSADSNRSSSNAPTEVAAASGVSFKDVLVQFAKMSQHQQGSDRRNTTPPAKSQALSKAPPYPEVTLHPVLPTDGQSPPNASSSLLHGILTKNNGGRGENQVNSRSTTFSPTLARLLTTPDRSSISTTITTALRGSNTNTTAARVGSGPVSITDLLSTSKNRNELTITPIISNLQPAKLKEDAANASDEDPDDNADRLVIDESEEQDPRADEEEVEGETVPECQGCHMKSAQFVCAGCGNQWYCSRNCQVTAWDEHSEVCSG